MPTTDTNIWDYVVTYGGPSLFMTAVFLLVMPIAWFKLARPRFKRWPSRLAVMLAVWTLAWFIAYGDVLMIAREAKRLCETEAGLKVYRTVEVDGFAGTNDIEKWATRGFSFVEDEKPGGSLVRYMFAGNVKQAFVVPKLLSKYEFSAVQKNMPTGIVRRSEQVCEISTREVIGERVMFELPPGMLDRKLIGSLGFHRSPVWCFSPGVITSETSNYPAEEVLEKTLFAQKRARN